MASTPNFSSATFTQFNDAVNRTFMDYMFTWKPELENSAIVIKETIPHGTGLVRIMAERLNISQYSTTRDPGDDAEYAEIQYGYEKPLYIKTEAKAIGVDKQMRDGGKDNAISDLLGALITTVPNRRELDIAHRFGFAWSTSYTDKDGYTIDTTGGDSLAMIYTAHTLTGSATTYSNQITGNPQFSKGALTTAIRSFIEESYDNLGKKTFCDPDTILTTDDPDTVYLVREQLNATSDVDAPNSGTINRFKNAFNHVFSRRIATTAAGAVDTDKRKYWFLIDSKMSDLYLGILNEPSMSMPGGNNNGQDILSDNWTYKVSGDYGICHVTGRWVRGSKGDGS